MGTIGVTIVGIWNAIVAAFPTVFHAACQIVDKGASSITF
jgi:hypothetical protein